MRKVSIVSACYNKAPYIGEFLQSIYNQKWDNIELILVNDGSTDGTRDVIAEWEPRFIDRGFSVQIVDQENRGVTAAIASGLEYVSGDFFCVPDCDDILNPEYVSKMADILISNDDISRVVCDCDKFCWILDNGKGLKNINIPEVALCNLNLINGALLWRFASCMCANMVRSTYLPQLKSAFKIDFRQSQEPQSGVVFGHIGNTVYLSKNLYFYRANTNNSITAALREYAPACEFITELFDTAKKTLKLLPIDEAVLLEFANVADLGRAFLLMEESISHNQPEPYSFTRILTALSKLTIPFKHKPINTESDRWLALRRSVSNYLIGYDNPFHNKSRTFKSKGRIIAYGAYGIAAQELLPSVINTLLKPEVLWDQAMGKPDVMGVPVTRPDLASLTPDDTVLVFLRGRKVAAEICDLLSAGTTDNILYYYDILDYLADFYFPLKLD